MSYVIKNFEISKFEISKFDILKFDISIFNIFNLNFAIFLQQNSLTDAFDDDQEVGANDDHMEK